MKNILKSNIVIILFFAVFLLYGLVAFNDYNISPDEGIERTTGLINYKYAFPEDAKGTMGTVDFSSLPDLLDWRDRYYGSAAQYIPLLAERVFGFEMEYHRVIQIRHLFTFLLFWLASVVFFFLGKLLGTKKEFAFIGTVMLVLSPRILADSFYNIKDSVFLSLVVINLYSGILFIKKPGILRGLLLSFISAVCVNVRVLGGEVIFLCLLFALFSRRKSTELLRSAGYGCFTAVACLLFYMAITPVTWYNLIDAVKGILLTFSNYTSWTGYNYFAGEALRAWELPWYYIPLWILATTPEIYLVLSAVGILKWVRKNDEHRYGRLVVLLYVLIPLGYAVLRRPSLYNGWRHFYFVYPGLILFAAWGVQFFWEKILNQRWGKIVVCSVMGLSFLYLGAWVFKNHPFECVYFNTAFRQYAAGNLEKDYWEMAQEEALKWIAENDSRPSIAVRGGSVEYLPEGQMKNRFVGTTQWNEADYVIYSNVSVRESERFDGLFLAAMAGDRDYEFDGFELYDEVHRIEVDGICICKIYKRTHNKMGEANIRFEDGAWYYDLCGIEWVKTESDTDVYLEGKILSSVGTDCIGIQTNGGILPENIEVSKDGENWIRLDKDSWNVMDEERIRIDIEYRVLSGIRLCYGKQTLSLGETDAFSTCIGFYIRSDEILAWKNPSAAIKAVSASENAGYQGFAVDGDIETRWDSGMSQRPGIAYELILKQSHLIGGITLDYGTYADDYPRGIIIYGSVNGEKWEEIAIMSNDDKYYEILPTNVNYIRLELTKECAWNWSVCEITLWSVLQ